MDPVKLLLFALGGYVVYEMLSQASSSGTVDPATGEVIMTQQQSSATIAAKVQQFAEAIATAEGFGRPGAVPTTHHNPGDLGPGDTPGYSKATFTDGSNVTQLPDDQTGWAFLYAKIERAFTGQSAVYSPQMTITQWAQKYAGDWQNWSANVAAALGVTPDTVIADWINS